MPVSAGLGAGLMGEALPGLLADWSQDPSSGQGLGQAGSSEEQSQ